MKISVTVTLKKDVLDPQGKVVKQTLKNMGHQNIENVRQGKYFEIELNENDKKKIIYFHDCYYICFLIFALQQWQ